MDIHVNKNSETSVQDQIAAQLVFLIGTGRLKPGTLLPSVRALAHRLGVHRNTVSRAYHDAVLNKLVEKRAGRRPAVRAPQPDTMSAAKDLDSLLDVAMREARRRGFSSQQLYDRLGERIAAPLPDRLLVLSEDPGMRRILVGELKQRLNYPIEACAPAELVSTPKRCAGALVVSPQGHIPGVRDMLPRDRPAIAIEYSSADVYLESFKRLTAPSVIAVVSASRYFLKMACGVLASAVDSHHSTRSCLISSNGGAWPRAADVIVCDALAYAQVRSSRRTGMIFTYRLISDDCLDTIAAAMSR